MNEDEAAVAVEEKLPFWSQHRFLILLVVTIVVSLILTCVSVAVYYTSGAAQLDLSRPGYQSVSGQIEKDTDVDEYGAFGPVNKSTINEFTKTYDKQAAKAKGVDAFNGDPLNPEVLEFGTANASE